MPDVILKDGTKKSFPYTEIGIASAKQFAETNGGEIVGSYHADSPTKGDWGMYPAGKYTAIKKTKKTSSPGAKEGQYWIPGKGYVPQGSDEHKKDLQDLRTGKRAFEKTPPPVPKYSPTGLRKKKKKVSAKDKARAEAQIPKVAGFFDDDHAVSKAKPGKARVKEAFKSPGVKIGTAVGTLLGGAIGQYAGRYDSLHSPREKVALKVAGAVPGGMIGSMVGAKAETLVKKGKRWLKVRKRAKEIASKK